MKFKNRSRIVDAIQYNNLNRDEIEKFIDRGTLTQELESETAYLAGQGPPYFKLIFKTTRNTISIMPSDWVVKDTNGEFYIYEPRVFENFFSKVTEGLTYGNAIDAVNDGLLIAREGWNGKGMFIFKQVPAEIGQDIISKMQSLPQCAKDRLIRNKINIKYTNQMILVQPDGRADSWVASSSDTFATDWMIVE